MPNRFSVLPPTENKDSNRPTHRLLLLYLWKRATKHWSAFTNRTVVTPESDQASHRHQCLKLTHIMSIIQRRHKKLEVHEREKQANYCSFPDFVGHNLIWKQVPHQNDFSQHGMAPSFFSDEEILRSTYYVGSTLFFLAPFIWKLSVVI